MTTSSNSDYRRTVLRLLALCMALSLVQFACYNTYFISKPQLEKLEATVEQKASVRVIIDGCDTVAAGEPAASLQDPDNLRPLVAEADDAVATDAAAATTPKAVVEDDIDPETGCPMIRLNTASPLRVIMAGGDEHRVTPFNFAITDSQLVSPDYDLLLPLDAVSGAEVQTFSGWKTGLMIGTAVAAAVSTFVVITLTAGEERGFGQQ